MALNRKDLEEEPQAQRLAERLLAIGRKCAPRLEEPFRSTEHGDLLYDENGVPTWSTGSLPFIAPCPAEKSGPHR